MLKVKKKESDSYTHQFSSLSIVHLHVGDKTRLEGAAYVLRVESDGRFIVAPCVIGGASDF